MSQLHRASPSQSWVPSFCALHAVLPPHPGGSSQQTLICVLSATQRGPMNIFNVMDSGQPAALVKLQRVTQQVSFQAQRPSRPAAADAGRKTPAGWGLGPGHGEAGSCTPQTRWGWARCCPSPQSPRALAEQGPESPGPGAEVSGPSAPGGRALAASGPAPGPAPARSQPQERTGPRRRPRRPRPHLQEHGARRHLHRVAPPVRGQHRHRGAPAACRGRHLPLT